MARQHRWRGHSKTGVTSLTLWFIAYFGVMWSAYALLSPVFPHMQALLIASLLGLLVVSRGYRPILSQLRRAQSVIRQLGILWIFSEAAREATDSRKLGAMIVSIACKSLGATSAYLWMRDSQERCFTLAQFRGERSPFNAIPEYQVDFLPNVTSGNPLFLKRTPSVFHPQLLEGLMKLGTDVLIPLVYQDYLVGFLTLSARAHKPHYAVERAMMSCLGSQAAIAISGMRLIEESRRHSTRLSTLQRLYNEAQQRAVTDGLTRLFTHAYFKEQLELHIFEAQRYREDLGLMLIDIDHFKKFNDTYGHQIGDEVLREVARTIKDTVRACDLVARYGGEEIVVILPKTDLEGIYILAERVRLAVGEISIRDMAGSPIHPVTVSVGLSQWQTQETGTELVERADRALYEAKRNGRNQVCRNCA